MLVFLRFKCYGVEVVGNWELLNLSDENRILNFDVIL